MNRFAAYFIDTMKIRVNDYNESIGHKEYNDESLTDCLKAFWELFDDEFNYACNKQRFPNLQVRVANWLQGLPIGIDYTSDGIIKVALLLGSVDTNSTKRKFDAVVNNWFTFFAGKVIELSSKNNINMPR